MHYKPGKTELSKKVYVDENDKKDIEYISKNVEEIYIQDVPGNKKINL